MQTLVIRLLVFLALANSANAAQTTYNFNFSAGGTGSFVYDDGAMTANAITFDFGALGSIAPYGFGTSLTGSIFGTPPRAAILQNGTFFGVTQVAGNLSATVRLYTNGTYCVRPYPEPSPDYCLESGTYRIAPAVVPSPPSVSGYVRVQFLDGRVGLFHIRCVGRRHQSSQLPLWHLWNWVDGSQRVLDKHRVRKSSCVGGGPGQHVLSLDWRLGVRLAFANRRHVLRQA